MLSRVVAVGGALLMVCWVQAQETKIKLAVRGLDPVELSAGRETTGSTEISILRDEFTYRFANNENRKRFEQSPGQYEIQYGGACMKMGPLSGKGSSDRFAVHGGRIYLFASDQCLAAFKAAPDRFVDKPDDVPQGTADQREKAAQLLDKAIEGLGGVERVKALDHVVVRFLIKQTIGETTRSYTQQNTYRFPRTIRVDHEIGEYKYGWLLNDKGGYIYPGDEVAVESTRQFMTREMYHQVLPLLKAHERGELTAVATGAAKVGDTNVEQVAVAIGGSTTTLSIDPASGKVFQVSYRGRGGIGIGQIVKTYSDFRTVNGLIVPFAVLGTIDGKEVAGSTVSIESVKVDEPLEAGLLEASTATGG